jgi:hypothetical protein
MPPRPSGFAPDQGDLNRHPEEWQRILFVDDELLRLSRWRELAERQLEEEAEPT